MEPVNCFFQPSRQPVKNTTEQSTAQPSRNTLPVNQKQSKWILSSSSAKKTKVEIFWALKCFFALSS